MDVRAVLAECCVLLPNPLEVRASGHAKGFRNPAPAWAKPFLCARKVDCAGVIRLFNLSAYRDDAHSGLPSMWDHAFFLVSPLISIPDQNRVLLPGILFRAQFLATMLSIMLSCLHAFDHFSSPHPHPHPTPCAPNPGSFHQLLLIGIRI